MRAPTRALRPRWVETADGDLAIHVQTVGTCLMLRRAFEPGGYFWRDLATVRRRADLDINPDPAWLAQARVSTRPAACLWWLLGRVPPVPDPFTAAPVTEPNDGFPDHDFDTDADGRPR